MQQLATTRIDGLSDIIERYDLVLLDAWGVLHDGRTVFPGALECLQRLSRHGIGVVIVSNAARRRTAVEAELSKTGLPRELYLSVESSGEMTWRHLLARLARDGSGQRGFYLGPSRSRSLCDGLDCRWVSTPADADFVLNTGAPQGNPADAGPLRPLVERIVALDLPMICANPDMVAVRAGVTGISAGAIASLYTELGGRALTLFGKPDREIFERAIEAGGGADRSRVLMIGDGIPTDIVGATRAGIDSLLIAGGIHRQSLPCLTVNTLKSLTTQHDAQPTWVTDLLYW